VTQWLLRWHFHAIVFTMKTTIDSAGRPMTLKRRGKDVVAVPDVGLPTLTADAVRETLEHIRR